MSYKEIISNFDIRKCYNEKNYFFTKHDNRSGSLKEIFLPVFKFLTSETVHYSYTTSLDYVTQGTTYKHKLSYNLISGLISGLDKIHRTRYKKTNPVFQNKINYDDIIVFNCASWIHDAITETAISDYFRDCSETQWNFSTEKKRGRHNVACFLRNQIPQPDK